MYNKRFSLKFEFKMIKWIKKRDEPQGAIVASIMDSGSSYMLYLDSDQPLQLNFAENYGNIIDIGTFGDGEIVIGFENAHVSHYHFPKKYGKFIKCSKFLKIGL